MPVFEERKYDGFALATWAVFMLLLTLTSDRQPIPQWGLEISRTTGISIIMLFDVLASAAMMFEIYRMRHPYGAGRGQTLPAVGRAASGHSSLSVRKPTTMTDLGVFFMSFLAYHLCLAGMDFKQAVDSHGMTRVMYLVFIAENLVCITWGIILFTYTSHETYQKRSWVDYFIQIWVLVKFARFLTFPLLEFSRQDVLARSLDENELFVQRLTVAFAMDYLLKVLDLLFFPKRMDDKAEKSVEMIKEDDPGTSAGSIEQEVLPNSGHADLGPQNEPLLTQEERRDENPHLKGTFETEDQAIAVAIRYYSIPFAASLLPGIILVLYLKAAAGHPECGVGLLAGGVLACFTIVLYTYIVAYINYPKLIQIWKCNNASAFQECWSESVRCCGRRNQRHWKDLGVSRFKILVAGSSNVIGNMLVLFSLIATAADCTSASAFITLSGTSSVLVLSFVHSIPKTTHRLTRWICAAICLIQAVWLVVDAMGHASGGWQMHEHHGVLSSIIECVVPIAIVFRKYCFVIFSGYFKDGRSWQQQT